VHLSRLVVRYLIAVTTNVSGRSAKTPVLLASVYVPNVITICSIKRKENSGKKFFLFIKHEVLFYETPFLHRARRNYLCGATALERERRKGGADYAIMENGIKR
jgi:hypothetical protein